jgi:phenylalanyl-tRNA synthetase beta chain
MKFSENWLRALVEIPADRAALVERLTLGGLEVESVEMLGGPPEGVLVARIVACEPHPNADRLRVCRVDTGHGEVQIVCGAPNARAGLIAPLATVGAVLPNGVAIKPAKLRGVESQGMLCSARELGIDADASGLMELPANAPVGTPLAAYLGLPDAAIELSLTPNRADCLGMLGLADEVAAEFGTHAKPFAAEPVPAVIAAPRVIRLEAGAGCPRYLGRSVRGIDMAAATPAWMQQRLRAAGLHPINAVVDITNYVMLETGQPLHAFDEAKLDGAIVVRPAGREEALTLLDGSVTNLDPSFLVIADSNKPLAVAGVMGGMASRVAEDTRDVFLEAAHFTPAAIIGRARKLGLTTDAAHRFERGVSPDLPRVAMQRATALLLEICGGGAGEIIEAALPEYLPKRHAVILRRARTARVLGVTVPDQEVVRILSTLGMTLETVEGGWLATPPSRRFDIEREEDLIEEVARIHGYARIPARLPSGSPPAPGDDETVSGVAALRAQLVARDFREAICYAFVDPDLLRTWRLETHAVMLANPLSAEMAVMRTSLLPGLVDALARNRRRQQTRVRMFECGVVFEARDSGRAGTEAGSDVVTAPVETTMLAAVACGSAEAEQWAVPARALDFFDLKGDLQSLLAASGALSAWHFDSSDLPTWLHPGRGARVLRDGVTVGALGALHPALQRQLDLPETYAFEVRLEALRARRVPAARDLPRFPSIRRDVAIEVDEGVAWADVAAAIRSGSGTNVKEVALFDCFRGQGISPGRKSLAIGLILQDGSRTLTDQDADLSVAGVLALLEREFKAKLRS